MSEDQNVDHEFDLDAWKKQGENRIEVIDDVIDELKRKVEMIADKIDTLQDEKVEILKALGKWKEPEEGSGNGDGRKGKVMIKPVLLSTFVERSGQVLSEEQLIDAVQEEKPTASAESIRISLRKLVNAHDSIKAMENDSYIYTEEAVESSSV